MRKYYEGLPAAANMEQSILRAQQQTLTDVEQARRAGIARTFVPGHGAGTTVLAWWNPTQE